MRSQDQGTAHPEGYLWLNSRVHTSTAFRYDLATARCALPTYFIDHRGRIDCRWRYYSALVFQPPCGSDHEIRLENKAREAEARQLLYEALYEHPEYISTVAELLAEYRWLGKVAPGDASAARRVLQCIPFIPPQIASDLREAILAKGPDVPPGEPEAAAA